jgi:hypothetical protein
MGIEDRVHVPDGPALADRDRIVHVNRDQRGPLPDGPGATAALVLAATGALRGWLPARASRIDPAWVLREV